MGIVAWSEQPRVNHLSTVPTTGTGSQLKGSTVSLSSLVGPEALAQTFNEVDLAKTSAQQLWEQARCTARRTQESLFKEYCRSAIFGRDQHDLRPGIIAASSVMSTF